MIYKYIFEQNRNVQGKKGRGKLKDYHMEMEN